jgi:diaminohydroxyphosphoribosylaminopyrimidine deaminase/5-amino-6-(5-phosphoribosylamino)uracil reductase
MDKHEAYMYRCMELARSGAGHVAPNPMVGAVLVFGDRIIGEGYHQKYGEAHAEVNCIASVSKEDIGLIKQSTMYVSLEPCTHFGKTPPCADLIIRHKIPTVVIGCRDPFTEVNGKGIEKLETAGVQVIADVLQKECVELNRRFFCFYTKFRPYVILKWAQTNDRKISSATPERLLITNEVTNRLVHKWRSEEASIMVGTNTVLSDDPMLTTRLWKGPSPIRVVLDMDCRLPSSAKVFNDEAPTIVFNSLRHGENGSVFFYQITRDTSVIHQMLNALYGMRIQSVMVEGGPQLLQSFIDEDLWDEARIITNETLSAGKGMAAPTLNKSIQTEENKILNDRVEIYRSAFS